MRKLTTFFLGFVFCSLIHSCSSSTGGDSALTFVDSSSTHTTYERDLHEMKDDGVLHAITIYSSTSYFLYKGEPMGFEYELLSRLADDLGLELKITVAEDIDELFKMLNAGEGDLIAYGLTVTEPRKELVQFTNHHYVTHQTLVQRMPDNWRSLPGYKIEKQVVSNTLELMDDTIWVRANSSYSERLKNLQSEIGAPIHVEHIGGKVPTGEIIKMVVDGKIDRTVADFNIASINKTYYPQLHINTQVSFSQRIAWAVRKSSPELLTVVNDWISREKKTDDYYVIYNKYFKNTKSFKRRIQSDFYSKNGGKISPFDGLIKENAEDLGWDWRLLCSQVYQESRFDPKAKSWAGARGLIQLMPATAKEVGVVNSLDPEQNLEGGTEYLSKMRKRFMYVKDSVQRIKFTLAAFNCGFGHVTDAITLAEKNGDNPEVWDDHVEEYILKLSDKRYYLDSDVKYGFVRGREPYNYVKDIFLRFEHYRQFIEEA